MTAVSPGFTLYHLGSHTLTGAPTLGMPTSMLTFHLTNLAEESQIRRAAKVYGCSVAFLIRKGATALASEILGEPPLTVPLTKSPEVFQRYKADLEDWRARRSEMWEEALSSLKNHKVSYQEMSAGVDAWDEKNPPPRKP